MREWIRIGGLVAILASMSTDATGDDLCSAIRTAQAIGAVTDDLDALSHLMSKYQYLPVAKYEIISAKAGDTLEAIAKYDVSFAPEYGERLVKALNPAVSNRQLDVGELVRVPKTVPPYDDLWKIGGFPADNPWPELSKTLELDSQIKRTTDDAYVKLKNINIEPYESGDEQRIQRSIGRMSEVAFNASSNIEDFKAIDVKVASLQGTSYVRDLVDLYGANAGSIGLREIAFTAMAAAEKTDAINSGRVQIVVQTKSMRNKPVEGLRVYRATPLSAEANCMQETKVEFDTRSYEASGLVPIARWLVWAEDNKGHRSSPRLIDIVDQNDNGRKFDLTIDWVK